MALPRNVIQGDLYFGKQIVAWGHRWLTASSMHPTLVHCKKKRCHNNSDFGLRSGDSTSTSARRCYLAQTEAYWKLNRFGIGNMAETLEPDADGGLTASIRHDSPGTDKAANWLPAPADGFFMVMRIYQPEERLHQGKYVFPPVMKGK